ncbi:MAG: hypothetical protein WA879_09595, partial [Candidatus Acidiferrales bacterium]
NYPTPNAYITAIANAMPTVCGGGVFFFAGKEASGPVSAFAGGITEYDTKRGVSKGALFEAGGGEGIVGGAGEIVTGAGGKLNTNGIVYGGWGAHTPVAGGSAGLIGSSSGPGVYAEGSLFNRAVGAGAYINITTTAGCKQS